MPRWPRTGGRGLWSRTAVSGRRGGPPRHAAVVQPLPFPTTKSSNSRPVKRSRLWWTRGLPPVEDRDRRGTTWRTGPQGMRMPALPCVIRSPPPDPARDLHTARGRAIDLRDGGCGGGRGVSRQVGGTRVRWTVRPRTRRGGRTARLPSQHGGRRRRRGRVALAARRSRPGGDFSGRRTWPPSSPPAVGVESETIALETRDRPRRRPAARRERHDAVRRRRALAAARKAAAALEASSRSGNPPVPGTRRRVGRTTAPGLGADGAAPIGRRATAAGRAATQNRNRRAATARSGADSRAAPCGASGRAAGGAAVVLERLSPIAAPGFYARRRDPHRGWSAGPSPPTRRARCVPRRRSCRPSFAVAFEHRLAHRA